MFTFYIVLIIKINNFSDMQKTIKDNNQKFMGLFEKQQFEALANLYTPDCQVYPPGSKMIVGRDGKSRH